MSIHIRSSKFVVSLVLATLYLIMPVFAEPASKYHRATIHPSIVNLEPGEEEWFKVVMTATRLMAAQEPKKVIWSVNDIKGGNKTVGTIDERGVYRAPDSIPSPREIHICAEVPESANRYLWATVIIGEGEPTYKQYHVWSEPVEEGKDRTKNLKDPHGIGLDKKGNVLIADQFGNAVLRYTPQGEFMGRIDKGSGSLPGEVTQPRIVMSDPNGDIFVSDSKGDRPRMQVFSHKGKFKRIFAEKGKQPGMILRAHGIGWDPQERLFAVDIDNMRVNVYDKKGNFLYDWGTEGVGKGEFNAPHGLFVDKNGDVFTTGYYGPTQKFNAEGDFLLDFCHGDPPDGPVYFHNLTGDKWGNVYVMVRTKGGYQGHVLTGEFKKVSIMKYNNNGDYITSWSFSAADHRETSAVVDDEGRVYALFVGSKEMGVETFIEE